MISPTVGRVVLVFFSAQQVNPAPALVAAVHDDRLINVGGFNESGSAFAATSIPLLQDDDTPPEAGTFATWMPYQVQVAKTHAGLEERFVGFMEKLHDHFTSTPDASADASADPHAMTQEALKDHVAYFVAGVQSNMNVEQHIEDFIAKVGAALRTPVL